MWSCDETACEYRRPHGDVVEWQFSGYNWTKQRTRSYTFIARQVPSYYDPSQSCHKEYQSRRKIKWEYYSGDLNNPEDLAKHNLEPMMKKVLRSDIGQYLDSDTELNNILLKKAVHEEIVDFCKAVLKELNNRTFQVRSIIDWEKFTGGH